VDAVYTRVSSKQQDQKAQMAELKAWANAQEGEVVFYSEKESGTSMNRPEWQRLWNDLLAGRIKKLICWRIDRLGRTAKGLLHLRDELVARKVGFLSLREGLDLSTAAGRLMWGIVSSFAEYETEVRSERQLAGIQRVKEEIASGERAGYHKTRSGRQPGECPKTTDEVRQAVMEMYRGNKSITAISRLLKLSRPTLYRVIREVETVGASS
jgi:DNA invertase Pin-like site-specific DNA recombinase